MPGLSSRRQQAPLKPEQEALLAKISHETALGKPSDPPADHTGEKAGFGLSVLAHLALISLFMVGLHWKSEEPAAREAILFTELPSEAKTATAVPEKPVEPQPKPTPQPKTVEPKVTPQKAKPVEPSPSKQAKADIELSKPKTEPKKPEPKKPEPKPEPKKPEPKPEPKKPDPKPEPKKPDPKPEPKPDPKVNQDLLKKLREEEIARATGGLPTSNANASSASNSRNKAQYGDKIRQYVRSRIVFPGASSISGNPQAVFEVRQLPTGEIVSVDKKQSSGIPEWDNAVERALMRSSPLPKAEDGSVEPILVLSFRPKDVQ